MKTFEKYFEDFPDFLKGIVSQKPDYIVPVAKKGCKLLKLIKTDIIQNPDIIKYKKYFELTNTSVKNKTISIIDDATQYTSTLQEYRKYFEEKGANVKTYSFVGHKKLFEGKYRQYDVETEIRHYLPEPVYQEYILQQSHYLLEEGANFDLDHIIFKFPFDFKKIQHLIDSLKKYGYISKLNQYSTKNEFFRFSLTDVLFFNKIPYFNDTTTSIGQIKKIKFVYNHKEKTLYCSPLIFPNWDYINSNVNELTFSNIPFLLPYNISKKVLNKKNMNQVWKTYENIYYIFAISLAKAFAQLMYTIIDYKLDVKIVSNDFNATFGSEFASEFKNSILDFICDKREYEFTDSFVYESKVKEKKEIPKNNNLMELIYDLRNTYLKKVKKAKNRVGVHTYFTYDKIFSTYSNRYDLNEFIDYYCDLGILVPQSFIYNNTITRGLRSGEPLPVEWYRTHIIIAMIIKQAFEFYSSGTNSYIDITLVNKILTNFSYDYPRESNLELHCFTSIPYTYGPLTNIFHQHQEIQAISLYGISEYTSLYNYLNKGKGFRLNDTNELIRNITKHFDNDQEIPYSELTTYFSLLLELYNDYGTTDVLNALSITRNEETFYTQLHYNISMWISEFGRFFERNDISSKISDLTDTFYQSDSSIEKLKFPELLKSVFSKINEKYSHKMQYVKTSELLNKHYNNFNTEFEGTLLSLSNIIKLQHILVNICLYVFTADEKYIRTLNKLNYATYLKNYYEALPFKLELIEKSDKSFNKFVEKLYKHINNKIYGLRKPSPNRFSRLIFDAQEKAKNIAIITVYQNKYSEICILYIDFTGLRKIPEPKEYIIGKYYQIVEKINHERGGIKLYGGKGGDDAFTLLFNTIEQGIECARDIKHLFQEDIFTGLNYDVRFGIHYTQLPEDNKEVDVIKAWGLSKDCCEYKNGFRNRGHLLISESTIQNLLNCNKTEIIKQFNKLDDVKLKNVSKDQVYFYSEIIPLIDS